VGWLETCICSCSSFLTSASMSADFMATHSRVQTVATIRMLRCLYCYCDAIIILDANSVFALALKGRPRAWYRRAPRGKSYELKGT